MSLEQSEEMVITSSVGITPTTSNVGLMVNPLDKVRPTIDIKHTNPEESCFYDNRPFET